MSTKILFVFEGAKTEKNIVKNLSKFFANENTIISCAYCTTIYKMYKEISNDNDLDTFNLLKSIEFNKETLKEYKRSDFAEIYMFFDYDGHATNASDKKLRELLSFFNEETEKGKLYLSYPMVESLKHIENYDDFEHLKVPCKTDIDYKKIVRENGLENLKLFIKYDEEIWKILIAVHLKKMNKIVNNSYELPNEIIDQRIIFNNQENKYINIDKTVAVLSSFPMFLHDYYGNQEVKKRLNK